MFTRLLDSARAEARQQVSTPIKSSKNNSAAPAAAPEELSNDDLCDLFSEFLFDIFDANCMEEFKQIEALEMSHCTMFADWVVGDEFTLEQGSAHHQFCLLFESLCSDFLLQYNVTQERLFGAAKAAMEDEKEVVTKDGKERETWEQSAKDQANEIWEVVRSVENICVWAEQMKDIWERQKK